MLAVKVGNVCAVAQWKTVVVGSEHGVLLGEDRNCDGVF